MTGASRRSRRAWARATVVASLGLAVSMLLGTSAARAQTGLYFDEFGGDARSAAMGQAFTGLADNAAAAYYNPGGLGFAPPQTGLGYRFSDPDLHVSFRGTRPADVSTNPPATQGLEVSVVSDLDQPGLNKRFPWLEPLAMGVEVFLPLPQVNSFMTFNSLTEVYFFRYDTRPDVLSLVFSLAYRITDWFSVGAGMMPNFNSFQANHANIRLNAPADDPTGGTDLELKQEADSTTTPIFGFLLKPPVEGLRDVLSLGFSYRGRVKNYFGTGQNDQSVGLGRPDGSFFQLVYLKGDLVNFVGFVPEQYTLGLGIKPDEHLTIGLDLTYKRFEDFAFWLDEPPNPKFHNTWVPRLGAEYRMPADADIAGIGELTALVFRAGYYFEPNANPSLAGPMNIIDNNQHVVSAGLGVDTRLMNKYPINYDLSFQAHVFEPRRTANALDPLVPPFEATGHVFASTLEINFGW